MKRYFIIIITLICYLMYSCRSQKGAGLLFSSDARDYLTDQVLGYWRSNYKFPTSFLQARDTNALYFEYYETIDSVLLHVSGITFVNMDTCLLITYHSDTIVLIKQPCSCEWSDEMIFPRAYDSLNNLMLDDPIPLEDNSYLYHLTDDIERYINPVIEKEMKALGYSRPTSRPQINALHARSATDASFPPYLLIEYNSKTDSIQLMKACGKYSCFLYPEYEELLRKVLSAYCKRNHVSRFLAPIDVYLKEVEARN